MFRVVHPKEVSNLVYLIYEHACNLELGLSLNNLYLSVRQLGCIVDPV